MTKSGLSLKCEGWERWPVIRRCHTDDAAPLVSPRRSPQVPAASCVDIEMVSSAQAGSPSARILGARTRDPTVALQPATMVAAGDCLDRVPPATLSSVEPGAGHPTAVAR